MTLLSVLAGLFPPPPLQTWSDSLSWMPIPYQYDKDATDYTLRRPLHYCPTYTKELEGLLQSDEVLREIKANRDVFNYVSEKTKRPMKTFLDLFGIWQTLTAETTMNLTLPEWTKSVFPEPLSTLATKQTHYENYNSVLKKLNGGRMLGKVVEHMWAKSEDALNRKIYLYSGHENNVINVLAALNIFLPHVPKYTAAVIVELHHVQEGDAHGVKVFYLRDAGSEPEVQKLEGCDALCPLNSFVRIAQPHVSVNYTAECGSHVNLD